MKALVVYKNKVPSVLETKSILQEHGYKVKLIQRRKLIKKTSADLIVPVGGDGTVLSTIPFVNDSPVIAVNAFPKISVGFFCVATAKNLKAYLTKIELGKINPKNVPLLEVLIEGKKMKRVALNEFLIASNRPAHTSKYEIIMGKKKELQRSSGVWVCAGPGSTAATHSAGGKKMSIDSCKLQFVVREPCPYPCEKYEFKKGVLEEGKSFEVISHIDKGMIFPDGKYPGFLWKKGKKAVVRIANKKLQLYI